MPASVLGAGDTMENETDMLSALTILIFQS